MLAKLLYLWVIVKKKHKNLASVQSLLFYLELIIVK